MGNWSPVLHGFLSVGFLRGRVFAQLLVSVVDARIKGDHVLVLCLLDFAFADSRSRAPWGRIGHQIAFVLPECECREPYNRAHSPPHPATPGRSVLQARGREREPVTNKTG